MHPVLSLPSTSWLVVGKPSRVRQFKTKMNWILVSSYDNPGDAFIRMGVEQLVREVDLEAKIHVLYKGMPEQWNLDMIKADKIIWCGMPFLWSFPTHNSLTIYWREPLLKKLYQRKNDFLILGAGTAGLCAEKASEAFTRVDDIHCTLDEALDNSFHFTMRDDCLDFFDIRNGIQVLPCPASFAHEQAIPEPNNLVCNFMENGGHFKELAPNKSILWNNQLMNFASGLREQGASFAPHSKEEAVLANLHGFKKTTYSGPRKLLGELAGCKRYIGNRIHGAIVAASVGADSTCIGFDLRLRAAEIVGSKVNYFDCFSMPPTKKYNLVEARKSYIEILKRFIK